MKPPTLKIYKEALTQKKKKNRIAKAKIGLHHLLHRKLKQKIEHPERRKLINTIKILIRWLEANPTPRKQGEKRNPQRRNKCITEHTNNGEEVIRNWNRTNQHWKNPLGKVSFDYTGWRKRDIISVNSWVRYINTLRSSSTKAELNWWIRTDGSINITW